MPLCLKICKFCHVRFFLIKLNIGNQFFICQKTYKNQGQTIDFSFMKKRGAFRVKKQVLHEIFHHYVM